MTKRGLCYEHTRIQDGRKLLEDHHPFGRYNKIVERIVVQGVPGNWHRALDARRDRRPEILKRPGENPLHRIAAAVATLGEAADGTADSATEWLLILAGRLDEWRPGWIGEMPKWRP
jgi:hypothetical protein